MIERIIEYCVRNRFLVIVLTAALAVGGVYAAMHTPVDAIPDLSENQVIVFTDWMGRSPQEIEDQITYPLSVNLQGLQGVKAVRSSSEFNFSMINVIFEDSMDFYAARLRVLERLSLAETFLPRGVVPYLAPDATALGQIFWYTVEGEGRDLGELRALQDWYVRYQLNSVPGVAQVASVGGFPREYQIDVDPNLLRAYGVSLGELYSAVARANSAVGGRVVHKGNAEYVVRGVGWIRDLRDIEAVVVAERGGIPVTVGRVAKVQMGTEFRRAVLDKGGKEVTGGVVMMRFGENPLDVTRRVKEKIRDLQEGLPEGVRIVPFYERTRLIEEALHTVTGTLREEIIVASLVVIFILGHFGGALVICVTLPLAVLISFILMKAVGIPSNIMSLSGIAIAIGVLVDQSIVMTENAMHHLRMKWGDGKVRGDTTEFLLPALKEVGRPLFFSVLIMVLSFLPVFALGGMEGKMFHPLAFTKTFALIGALFLTITLLPALIPVVMKGRMKDERENWLVRSFINVYEPILRILMPHPGACVWFMFALFLFASGFLTSPWITAVLALLCALCAALLRSWRTRTVALGLTLLVSFFAWKTTPLGREFMPPLDEGSILDMPVTVPRASVTQVADDLKARDAMIASFPEVESVVGKAGRAETPTDPSPIEMVETIVNLHPKDLWPRRHLRFEDAAAKAEDLVESLVEGGFLRRPAKKDDLAGVANDAAMAATGQVDAGLRAHARDRQREVAPRIGRALVETVARAAVVRVEGNGFLLRSVPDTEISAAVDALAGTWAPRLLEVPLEPDVREVAMAVAKILEKAGAVKPSPDLFAIRRGVVSQGVRDMAEALGALPVTAFAPILEEIQARRHALLREHTLRVDGEIEEKAATFFASGALSGALSAAKSRDLVAREPSADESRRLEADAAAAFRGTMLWRKTKPQVRDDMDSAIQVPGWGNIWTQPIINRIDMLATGIRTMVGVKVYGQSLDQIRDVAQEVTEVLRDVPGAVDVYPDQITGKPYVEVWIDREKAARYGISVGDIQDTIEVALGGRTLTTTVEGRQRFPVRVRYSRDYREDEELLRRTLIATGMPAGGMGGAGSGGMDGGMGGALAASPAAAAPLQVPLSDVAEVKVVEGPAVIKSENGLLRAYVQLNVRGRDVISFVEDAQRAVAEKVTLPEGSYLEWTGQFEHQMRAKKTLTVVIPLVILLIVVILYITYSDFWDLGLMMLAVPGAVAGGIIFQAIFGFNFSVAVWVGYIACFGMATETGIIMLVYLREAVQRYGGLEKIDSLDRLREIVIEGAVHRLRPKLLTEGTTIIGLAPMLWATGTGAEIMSPMAAPVLGGILMADEVVDVFIPVLFYWVRAGRWRKLHPGAAVSGAQQAA
ncbi:MAG: efflux RND transporter permease subunit [Planctomycetaceae bacterium]|nr:efflux RND transporter permease subunit [Planctomycetota bacterium]NUN51161.1 efflux RND transporter permease subunit [Planctomycetaceae bacterium]